MKANQRKLGWEKREGPLDAGPGKSLIVGIYVGESTHRVSERWCGKRISQPSTVPLYHLYQNTQQHKGISPLPRNRQQTVHPSFHLLKNMLYFPLLVLKEICHYWNIAMGHTLWLHFGVDEHPFATYFDVLQRFPAF